MENIKASNNQIVLQCRKIRTNMPQNVTVMTWMTPYLKKSPRVRAGTIVSRKVPARTRERFKITCHYCHFFITGMCNKSLEWYLRLVPMNRSDRSDETLTP